MSATASDVLSGLSDPSANLGSLSSGAIPTATTTPTKQHALSADPQLNPLSSSSTASAPLPSSGTSNTLTQGTSSGDTTSGGGITSDITKLLSQLFGGNGGSTLGLDMLLAGYGLTQAQKQQQENTAQADQLKQVGQPFISAGQGLLDKFKSGQINSAQQDVANTAQQQGNDILGLPQNAMLSKISQDYLSNVANQKLNPGDQAALDQSTQAAKQKLAQSMAASGITDSSVLDAQNAQIDQQAAINKQTLLNSYQQTGNAAFDKFVSTTEAGQKLILQGKQYVVTSLEQELQDALATTTEGLGPLEQAIQLQINSDTQLATSVGQLMSGLAQAYSMSLWKSGSGSGGSSTGGTLDTIGNLYNDVKGLFGSNSNTTTNSGSGSGTTNTGLPGSTTTGTTSTGGTYSGTQGTTTVGSQVSNPSSGGSGGSDLGSLTGDAGTAVGGYQAADSAGLLGGAGADGIDQAAVDSIIATDGTSTGAATGAATGSEGLGGGASADEAGGTASGAGWAMGGFYAAATYLATQLGGLLGEKGGVFGSNSVNLNSNADLSKMGLSVAKSPVSGSPQSAVQSNATGLMYGLGNDASQGSGQFFYKDASGKYTWVGQQGNQQMLSVTSKAKQLFSQINSGKTNGSATTTSDGSTILKLSSPEPYPPLALGQRGTPMAEVTSKVLNPDGSITLTGTYTGQDAHHAGGTPFTTTDNSIKDTYAQYGASSGAPLMQWLASAVGMVSVAPGSPSH